MKHYSPPSDTLVLFETAGEWLAHREDDSWTDADEQEFLVWLQRDIRHQQAFERVSRTWHNAAQLTTQAQPVQHQPVRFGGRWTWSFNARVYAGAVLMLCIALSGGGYWYSNHATYTQLVETSKTQAATYTLPDGTQIAVNRNTQLEVTYYPWRRDIHLQHGEVFFDVAKNNQSFNIIAGHSEVRVLGTAFNVDMTDKTLTVAVEHGKVAVTPDRVADHVIELTANALLTVDRQTGTLAQSTLPHQAIGSWRDGRLVFRNTALSEVAVQLSRYRSQPVQVIDRVLAHRKISGVANIADPDAFLTSLPTLVGAKVIFTRDGSVQIDQQ